MQINCIHLLVISFHLYCFLHVTYLSPFGSFSLIFSRTLISSLAASRYLSMFLMTFTATSSRLLQPTHSPSSIFGILWREGSAKGTRFEAPWRVGCGRSASFSPGGDWAVCCVPPQKYINLWFKMGYFCSQKFRVRAKGKHHPVAPPLNTPLYSPFHTMES